MIYTKTGDKGETSLASGARVSKTDARIEAYGTVDELNSWIGLLRVSIDEQTRLWTNDERLSTNDQLTWIQNKLFNLGAALSEAPGEWIGEADVLQLEQWIDAMQEVVPKQKAFVLPAGSEAVCRCHVCRTICRRAERKMIASKAAQTDLKWINRLSDYLFVLSRYLGFKNGENVAIWRKN